MSAADRLFHFATTQDMASEEMAARLLAEVRAEAAPEVAALRARVTELEARLSPETGPLTVSETWIKPRQAEDPHSSELHHDYALGRDLPAIPHQTTGRCPQGHTFEDCTCGGTR